MPWGMLTKNCPFLENTFEPYFSLWTEMIRATSNQKPTLSKRSSYEKRRFKLEVHLWYASLPEVDRPQEKKEKNKMNKRTKRKIDYVMHLKIGLSPNKNQESQNQKMC